MHAFDLRQLGRRGASASAARGRARRSRRSTASTRTLDADMLVIADARSRAGDRRRHGRRRLRGVGDHDDRSSFESAYFKPASVRRTSKRLGLKTEASSRFERGADINAPVVGAAARRRADGADRRRHGSSGPIVDCYPRPREPRRICTCGARGWRALLGAAVPDADVVRILRGARLRRSTRDADGWDVVGADLPRRPAARGRSHRGGRPPLRLRPARPTFPALTAAGAAARSADRARSARPARADGGRALRGGDVRVHRGAAPPRRSADGARRRARRHRQPAVGEVRHAAAVAAAGPGRRGRAQPPARPARRRAVRDRHAVHGARRDARRRARLDRRRRQRALVRRRARRRFLRRQGRRRAPLRGARRRRRASTPAARAVPRRRARRRRSSRGGRRAGRRRRPAARRRSPTRAALPRQDAVFVAELDLDALDALRATRRSTRRSRCRAIRSSSATSRSSSPTPCLRKSFVAPFAAGARRRRRSSASRSSIATGQGRAGRPVSLSLRLTFQAAERTLTDAEVQQSDRHDSRGARARARRGATLRSQSIAWSDGARVAYGKNGNAQRRARTDRSARREGEAARRMVDA